MSITHYLETMAMFSISEIATNYIMTE